MIQLIRDLGPIRSGVVCDGADLVAKRMCEELPFTVHEFASGSEHLGWTVPWSWNVQKATIQDSHGALIYDGQLHPLGVAAYSDPFTGLVSGTILKQHCFYSNEFDDALIYHCDFWYKPHVRTWGLCIPKTLFNAIDDCADYYVDIKATFTPGTMKVLEYVLPGEVEDSIVLNANACHPGCANDDLSGCAVGIEVMRILATIPDRRYTYRLIVAPEHHGSIFYLSRFPDIPIRCGLFLESLGTTGPLALQHSVFGDDEMDNALKNSLIGVSHYTGEFRSIVGNDESVFEACNIPFPSLSRCPFAAYHTSYDNADLMSAPHLWQAVHVVVNSLLAIDRDSSIYRLGGPGLVCLSNPKYDLYQPYYDPSIPDRRTITDGEKQWNRLMNYLPSYMGGGYSILTIANKHGLPFDAVYQYVKQWESKGLVKIQA